MYTQSHPFCSGLSSNRSSSPTQISHAKHYRSRPSSGWLHCILTPCTTLSTPWPRQEVPSACTASCIILNESFAKAWPKHYDRQLLSPKGTKSCASRRGVTLDDSNSMGRVILPTGKIANPPAGIYVASPIGLILKHYRI